MIGDLIIRSVDTGFLIPGVVASYINILTLTTKTACAVHPAMRLYCLQVPFLLRERAQARPRRGLGQGIDPMNAARNVGIVYDIGQTRRSKSARCRG